MFTMYQAQCWVSGCRADQGRQRLHSQTSKPYWSISSGSENTNNLDSKDGHYFPEYASCQVQNLMGVTEFLAGRITVLHRLHPIPDSDFVKGAVL
jgi:hypothetical protein